MQKQPLWTRDFLGICFSSFFIFMTFYTLLATLPIFVMDVLKGGKQQIGWVMTSFIIAAVLFRPFAGKWLDDLGRKKILLASLLLFMASTFVYPSIKNYYILLALRFIHGISFGVATTATGTIAIDLIPDQRKGEGLGYFSTSMNIAMVLGPFLGLTLIHYYSFPVLFVILSLFSLLAFLFGSITRDPGSTSIPKVVREKSLSWKAFIEPKAVPIALTSMLLSFAYSGILTFVPVYAKDLGMVQVASYFFVVYAIMIVLSRPFTGKAFDRFGEHYVIYPGILFYVIGLIGLSQAHTPFLFLTAGAIIGLGFGTLAPSFQTIAVKSAPSHRSGLATGTYFLFFDSGVGLGSAILGSIASSSNYSTMYLISSVIVAFAASMYFLLHHRRKKQVTRIP